MDQLFNADFNLTSLESHQDHEIVYMTSILDDQTRELNKERKGVQIGEISISLQLRESIYEKLQGLLESTSKMMLD